MPPIAVHSQEASSEVPTASTPGASGNWSVQQLTGFLAMVSSAEDERTASRVAVERAAEALGADLAVLLKAGDVVASVGFRRDPVVEAALADIAEGHTARLVARGVPDRPALAITVEPDTPSRLVFAREADDFSREEVHLARGMAQVLSLSLRLFRLAAEERRQRREAEMQSELNQRLLDSLQERQELLERLARIQRSITHGAVREDVLDAICLGARELLADEVAGLAAGAARRPRRTRDRGHARPRRARASRRTDRARRGHRLARHGGGPPDRLRGLPERRGRLEACSPSAASEPAWPRPCTSRAARSAA